MSEAMERAEAADAENALLRAMLEDDQLAFDTLREAADKIVITLGGIDISSCSPSTRDAVKWCAEHVVLMGGVARAALQGKEASQ